MRPRRSRFALAAALALIGASVGAGACTTASADTDTERAPCRSLATEADCGDAEPFTLDDGRFGSCRWFTGAATTRTGDSCSSGPSVGLCLEAGPTQPSCTYAPLEESYPGCVGTPGEAVTPAIWVEDGDDIVLLPNVCGPSVADTMSGRCGADPSGEPTQCECACL